MESSKNRFISLEGMEGCGKSTQIDRIEPWLSGLGKDVLVVREPGGTPIGEEIRNLLKHHDSGNDMEAATELLLFTASRAELTRKKIIPHLNRGGWVLCDRFLDSTRIYQGVARDLELDTVQRINHFAVDGILPGLTLLLDLPLEISMQRMDARRQPQDPRDRMEELPESFYKKVCQGYQTLLKQEPDRVVPINAAQTPDAVFSQIQSRIHHAFPSELDS